MTLLTDPIVRDIKRRLWFGETSASIAKAHPINASMVNHIRRGIRWSHVPWPAVDPVTKEPLVGAMPPARARLIEAERKEALREAREAGHEDLMKSLRRRLKKA